MLNLFRNHTNVRDEIMGYSKETDEAVDYYYNRYTVSLFIILILLVTILQTIFTI